MNNGFLISRDCIIVLSFRKRLTKKCVCFFGALSSFWMKKPNIRQRAVVSESGESATNEATLSSFRIL